MRRPPDTRVAVHPDVWGHLPSVPTSGVPRLPVDPSSCPVVYVKAGRLPSRVSCPGPELQSQSQVSRMGVFRCSPLSTHHVSLPVPVPFPRRPYKPLFTYGVPRHHGHLLVVEWDLRRSSDLASSVFHLHPSG